MIIQGTEFQKFLKLVFGIDYNTSATIFITLLVFVLGIVLQSFGRWIINFRIRKNLRFVFRNSVAELIFRAKNQSKAYSKTQEGLKFDNRSGFVFSVPEIVSYEHIKGLEYKSLFSAFIAGIENFVHFDRNERIKAFLTVWRMMESLQFWFQDSLKDQDAFINRYNDENARRNDAIDEYRLFFQQLMHDYDRLCELHSDLRNPKLEEFMNAILSIHREWTFISDRTAPHKCHRYLVVRIRILHKKFADLPQSSHINDIMLKATDAYFNLRNILKKENMRYENYSKHFERTIENLEYAINYLK